MNSIIMLPSTSKPASRDVYTNIILWVQADGIVINEYKRLIQLYLVLE